MAGQVSQSLPNHQLDDSGDVTTGLNRKSAPSEQLSASSSGRCKPVSGTGNALRSNSVSSSDSSVQRPSSGGENIPMVFPVESRHFEYVLQLV